MLVDLFVRGGWVMWPLLATSVVALAASLNRAHYLWRTRGDASALTREVLQALDEAGPDGARARCARSKLPLASVLAEGLSAWDGPEAELERRLEQSSAAALEKAEAGLPVLATALAVLPMLGFLGTILGLIDSFTVWEKAGADVGIEGLSRGIAAAMITTGAGLLGAIPYTVVYNVCASHAARTARALNHGASELIGRHRARRAPELSVVRSAGEAR
ncbi:MAG: MotA/TolQ/ExbB proton channel family protein [Myxococcaceae bacterium]